MSGELTVEEWRSGGDAWDAWVRSRPGASFCHAWAWGEVAREVFGHETRYLAARAPDGAVRAVLPLVDVRSVLFGRYLVSMPYLSYGGPIGDDDGVRAVTAAGVRRAEATGAKLLELRSRAPLPVELALSQRKITVLLELVPGDPSAVFQRFPAKLRSQVRRPQKEGVSVRFGPDQVGPFYEVFRRHMRDLGTPVMPRAFFEAVARTFGEQAWFGCAYAGALPVACGAGFRWGDEFEITWASALASHSRLAPNMGLYWAFIERAAAEGLAVFNFGRCTPGSGTHRFKSQWGAVDAPLYWYQWIRAGAPAATPSPDAAAYAWGPRLWKRLPLPVATLLGPRIVRGIP